MNTKNESPYCDDNDADGDDGDHNYNGFDGLFCDTVVRWMTKTLLFTGAIVKCSHYLEAQHVTGENGMHIKRMVLCSNNLYTNNRRTLFWCLTQSDSADLQNSFNYDFYWCMIK